MSYRDPEQFVEACRREMKRYPRSPIVVEPQTAKDIDMSGIFRMTPEEIDRALEEVKAA